MSSVECKVETLQTPAIIWENHQTAWNMQGKTMENMIKLGKVLEKPKKIGEQGTNTWEHASKIFQIWMKHGLLVSYNMEC